MKMNIAIMVIHKFFIILIGETDYNKLKVDELKSELKKKNINFPKNARKNELIELLNKN